MGLQDLLTVQSQAQIQSTYLALLQLAGFPTTGYQSGSVPLTLANLATQALADMTGTVQNVAASGFLQSWQTGALYTPADAWLDLKALSDYQLLRNVGQQCIRTVQLTDVGGGGPYTIAPGQLTVSTSGAAGVLTYTNTTGGTLPKSGTIPLTFSASSVGAAYNVPDGTITVLTTPLPGVQITYPAGITAQSITTSGADGEPSSALATRCASRWATIGGGASTNAYTFWATTAAPAITRVQVLEATPIGGQVTIYCAGPSGPAGTADVATVQTYVGAPFSQTGVRPLCVKVNVLAATAYPIVLSGTVNVASSQLATATSTIASALVAFSQTTKIGGTIYLSVLIDLVQKVAGVQNVNLSSPVADVNLSLLGTGLVANIVNSLTLVGV